MLQRSLDDALTAAMSAIRMTFVLVLILACMEPDFYYFG